VDAAAEEEEVVGGVEDFGEFEALGVEGESPEPEILETVARRDPETRFSRENFYRSKSQVTGIFGDCFSESQRETERED
jgi:hypothetical protein